MTPPVGKAHFGAGVGERLTVVYHPTTPPRRRTSTHSRDLDRSGDRLFNIASTFKTGHFLGYSVALNKLDGVYYVDPRPDMIVNERLREQIYDFQRFLTKDLWVFSK